jgi:DNA-binding LacI/PurR family transcriptional regulator
MLIAVVTMEDVARLAGVSKMTVSNVVNNRAGVSEPVRRRVLEVIAESGYRLNLSARTLKSGRTGVIGLAVPEVDRPYFGMLAAQVIADAARRGFHVAIEQTGAAIAGEVEAIAQSHNLQFDGLILSAVSFDPRRHRLADKSFPIVMLGEQDVGSAFDHVAMPNEEGTRAATEHLINRGCRRIAFVGGDGFEGVNVVASRHRGYVAALAERDLPADPALLLASPAMTLESGRMAVHRLVGAGVDFDGVVAVTDTVAQGVLRGLADHGLSAPDQVRVVGFDNIPESKYMVPSLTTVAPDHGWIAEMAVRLVVERIREPARPTARYVAPFDIIARESTR